MRNSITHATTATYTARSKIAHRLTLNSFPKSKKGSAAHHDLRPSTLDLRLSTLDLRLWTLDSASLAAPTCRGRPTDRATPRHRFRASLFKIERKASSVYAQTTC